MTCEGFVRGSVSGTVRCKGVWERVCQRNCWVWGGLRRDLSAAIWIVKVFVITVNEMCGVKEMWGEMRWGSTGFQGSERMRREARLDLWVEAREELTNVVSKWHIVLIIIPNCLPCAMKNSTHTRICLANYVMLCLCFFCIATKKTLTAATCY